MIIPSITSETMFIEAFREMDRMDNFSIDGLKALYEFFEDMSQDTGKDYELDVIALCCDFSEENWEDVARNYFDGLGEYIKDGACPDKESFIAEMLEFLEENTLVVYHDDKKVLYQDF